MCYFVLVFSSHFSIAITSLWAERANLIALRTFSYVCLICACLVLSVRSSPWCLGRVAACDCGILPFISTSIVKCAQTTDSAFRTFV